MHVANSTYTPAVDVLTRSKHRFRRSLYAKRLHQSGLNGIVSSATKSVLTSFKSIGHEDDFPATIPLRETKDAHLTQKALHVSIDQIVGLVRLRCLLVSIDLQSISYAWIVD